MELMKSLKFLLRQIRVFLKKEDPVKMYSALGVRIGKNTHILGCNIDRVVPYMVSIGDNTTITHATILCHDASTKKILGYTKVGRVSIGNDVFIGWGGTILGNVKIGNKVIVGAGTVITKDIPDNSVVVGNPCKIIGTYDDYVKKMKYVYKDAYLNNNIPSNFTENDVKELQSLLNDGGWGFIL